MIKETAELKACIAQLSSAENKSIGFIPTMGALHQGHLSLIKQCKVEGHLSVCSIFVNPTQFNQAEDFARYPRNVAADIILLEDAGCDILFHPEPGTMYPDGLQSEEAAYGLLTQSLEGFYRPGHFNGVVTIVRKLLESVAPNHLYMGQKDYQQCAVIAELIRRSFPSIELHTVATVREASGLAMSSRNARLSEEGLRDAMLIYDTLLWVDDYWKEMPLIELKEKAMLRLNNKLKSEYVEIVDPKTLEPLEKYVPGAVAVCLIAAWCGPIRLIDNMMLG